MTDKIKREVMDALEEDDYKRAVERLKTGLRRDPYWKWGHRTLGDIYLEKLNHSTYALIQYRKLREVKGELDPAGMLRLMRAYHQRGFDDKAAELSSTLEADQLPETLTILDNKFDPTKLYEELRQSISKSVVKNSEEYRKKYVQEGDEHKKYGNYFEAQRAYEKALEFGDEPRVRLKLSRCLIQRSRYPKALEQLKKLRGTKSAGDEAETLLEDVYERLGLNHIFDSTGEDDSSPGQSRRAS